MTSINLHTMNKFISLLAATFLFTINSFADDYEDEVRKTLLATGAIEINEMNHEK